MKYIEAFFWGIIAALIAVVFEFSVSLVLTISSLSITYILLVGFIEEIMKVLVIMKRLRNIFSGRNLILSSLALGLGFATTEFFFIAGQYANLIDHLKEIIEIVILHIGTAGVIGYLATLKSYKISLTIPLAFICAAAIHTIFNFLVLHDETFPHYSIFILLAVLVTINFAVLVKGSKTLANM